MKVTKGGAGRRRRVKGSNTWRWKENWLGGAHTGHTLTTRELNT